MRQIFLVAGARPNFVKIAALSKAFENYRKSQRKPAFVVSIVNTGQHYDYLMSRKFFEDLNIPAPKFNLNVGSGSHAVQTAKVMVAFEKLVMREKPDLVIVVGDVNSTAACALVAAKLRIRLAHVEAGLRSRDRTMPEEVNRIVTDALADMLFTTSKDASVNLQAEGIGRDKISFVGNVMIDSLLVGLKKAKNSKIRESIGLRSNEKYILMTLHRPANVDNDKDLTKILNAVDALQQKTKVVFPVHPRTKKMLLKGPWRKRIPSWKNLKLIDPLGYLDFIALMKNASIVLTDSGGVQEETTFLGVPCLTLRDNTERPITITHGTNYLVGRSAERIVKAASSILDGNRRNCKTRPLLWDGHAADRIIWILAKRCNF